MMSYLCRLMCLAVFCGLVRAASGVILLETGDPARNTSTPGDNSGWQYEGEFGPYLGTPIAPYYFVTARHIGGVVGMAFTFHGETFKTTAEFADPLTDLHIWQVDHAFAVYAPLYSTAGGEPGQELRVFGRGTQRGDEIPLAGVLRGWAWGPGDGVMRWGSNRVSAIVSVGDWPFVQAGFDSPGMAGEAHLSAGDSGGGVFIFQDGLWRLAGINYGVDDLYTAPNEGNFAAAIFDARGYYTKNDDGTFTLIDGADPVPTSFYSTEIAGRLTWIKCITGIADPAALPTEGFTDWQHAYFTPAQIADDAVSGPDADPDKDGVPNLTEFAFNLDPTCAETVVLTTGAGVRGLPLIQVETGGDRSRHLTVEFVRRTVGSGPRISCLAQFTSSLDPAAVNWEAGGTEAITPINPRWERVKTTDVIALDDGTAKMRFARVLVMQAGASPDTVQTRLIRVR